MKGLIKKRNLFISTTKMHFTVVLLIVFMLSSCKTVQLESRWKGNINIEIDGKDIEWENERFFFEKEDIALDIMNDDKYLYLCFSSPANKIPVKMIMQGFTVWFDTKGENKQKLGLRFFGEKRTSIEDGNNFVRSQMHQRRRRFNIEMLKKRIQYFDEEIEIITSKKKGKTYSIDKIIGTEAEMNIEDMRFTFELKIPYIQNEVYTCYVGVEQGSEIGVKLEIGPRNSIPPKGGLDGRPGGSSSGGGSPGGGKPGGMMGSDRDRKPGGRSGNSSHNIKFSIKLAEEK